MFRLFKRLKRGCSGAAVLAASGLVDVVALVDLDLAGPALVAVDVHLHLLAREN